MGTASIPHLWLNSHGSSKFQSLGELPTVPPGNGNLLILSPHSPPTQCPDPGHSPNPGPQQRPQYTLGLSALSSSPECQDCLAQSLSFSAPRVGRLSGLHQLKDPALVSGSQPTHPRPPPPGSFAVWALEQHGQEPFFPAWVIRHYECGKPFILPGPQFPELQTGVIL